HNTNAKFLFISPNAKAEILRLANKFNLDEKKIIVKEATRKEVPALLSLSKFAVFFIKPCYSKIASSPTKHGEIMAMGIPVISNAGVGDVKEIIEKYKSGFLINDFSDAAYAEIIKSILFKKTFDSEEIRNGAKEFYNLENAIKSYKKIYDIILQPAT